MSQNILKNFPRQNSKRGPPAPLSEVLPTELFRLDFAFLHFFLLVFSDIEKPVNEQLSR